MSNDVDFQSSGTNVFWGEIAPCEHIAQFYEHDGMLLDALEGFIRGGLKVGDSAIVIATAEHLEALEQRIYDSGVDVAKARRINILPWKQERLFLGSWQKGGQMTNCSPISLLS